MSRGSIEDGESAVAPFRALGPEADLVGPVEYADFQCSIDDPPGHRNWWTAEYLHVVTDDAIDEIHTQSLATPSPPLRSPSSSRGAARSHAWARKPRR